nr:putative nuclease HARBI1 [Helicoverpa armigera]
MDIFDSIDDETIEEDDIVLNYLESERRERVIRERPDNMSLWDDKKFHRRFRLEKSTVQFLLTLIESKIANVTNRNNSVPALQQLLLTLRFYACGSFYITIGDFAGIHNSTASKIIRKVTEAIASLRQEFVTLPANREEILLVQEGFFNIARFPRVIAALDCTHIKIISPGGNTAEDYRNRKGFFSLNVQAMCTSDLKFEDIVTRWPGSTHDSLIFSNSAAKFQFDTNRFQNGLVLGDSGYFLNHYLLTPLSDPRTEAERLYNESHIRTRNVIERCFGVWKRRFPVLSIGMRCRIPLAQDIIVATAILHNLARIRNESEPPVDPEVHIPQQPQFETLIADQPGHQHNSTRDSILKVIKGLV